MQVFQAENIKLNQEKMRFSLLNRIISKNGLQHFVYNRSHKTGKKLSHMKYSSKRSDFLRFYLYLCHVIDDFACR